MKFLYQFLSFIIQNKIFEVHHNMLQYYFYYKGSPYFVYSTVQLFDKSKEWGLLSTICKYPQGDIIFKKEYLYSNFYNGTNDWTKLNEETIKYRIKEQTIKDWINES